MPGGSAFAPVPAASDGNPSFLGRVPRPRHPSAEELAETLTGQFPASPEAVAFYRTALSHRPFELWPRPEDEAGDRSDFPEQQQENV